MKTSHTKLIITVSALLLSAASLFVVMRFLQQRAEELLMVMGAMAVVCLGAGALFLYGQYWPKWWMERIPMTNMRDIERSVGKPLTVTSNLPDGSIRWDYTRWWSGTAKVYFHTNGNFYRVFTDF